MCVDRLYTVDLLQKLITQLVIFMAKSKFFLKLNKRIFPALKSLHRSVRQHRFTLEADFPDMAFPNNASESTKVVVCVYLYTYIQS